MRSKEFIIILIFIKEETDAQNICDVHKTEAKLDSNADVLRGRSKCFPLPSLTVRVSGLKKNQIWPWYRPARFYSLVYY